MTTRLVDWAGAGWVHVPVEVFEREQSIGILLDRTGQSDRETADVIAEALGDLPVAVVQASAMARRDRYSLAAYLDMLERTTLEEDVRRWEWDEYPRAASAALRLAFQSALKWIEDQGGPRKGAIARVQLGILSMLAASGVPTRWLEKVDGISIVAPKTLSGLIASSVCQLSEDRSKVMIHELQGRVIREAWKDEPARWEWVEEEAAGLLGAVDVTAIPVRDSAGRRREALDLVEQLRATAGQDHSKTLFSYPRTADALAHALWHAAELGSPQAAVSLSDAVHLLDETLGPDDPRTLAARGNLAVAYQSAGRLDQAVLLFEQVLAAHEHVLGPDHPGTLAARNNLAGAYESAGRPDEAIDLFERTLEDRKRALGENHPDILTLRNNLAFAYRSAGRLDEAIDLFKRNLEDREHLLGSDHPDTLTSRNNIASAYRSAGRLDEAIDLFERTLEDREHLLGPDHPDTLTSRDNLASIYRSAGRLDEAIELHEQNLADRERILGADHPHTLTSRNNLADAYLSAGRLDQAIDLYEQNLTETLRILGPDHPNTRIFRDNLVDTYRTVGRDEDAAALLDPPPDPDDTDAEAPA